MVLAASGAMAAPSDINLNWGSQISRSNCPAGTLIINVSQTVINDADSGVGGNSWALDDYVRHISVVAQADGSFCATVSYQGSFTTFAGPSPGNTSTVGAGVVGTFEGGYLTNFSGTLLQSPSAGNRVSIRTLEYKCDPSGNCPGSIDWPTLYFSNTVGVDNLQWWGWVYHGGNNGSWVNSSDGNSGDITETRRSDLKRSRHRHRSDCSTNSAVIVR